MNKHHRTLELDRVLEMLAEQATCAASKELALRLEPCDNYRDAADALQRTADINTLTARYGTPGLGGIQDCTGALQRAKLGSRLSAGEILQVARVLRTIRTIKKWRGQGEALPPPMICSMCWRPWRGWKRISSMPFSRRRRSPIRPPLP